MNRDDEEKLKDQLFLAFFKKLQNREKGDFDISDLIKICAIEPLIGIDYFIFLQEKLYKEYRRRYPKDEISEDLSKMSDEELLISMIHSLSFALRLLLIDITQDLESRLNTTSSVVEKGSSKRKDLKGNTS
jgi:hypothetical protein